MAQRPQGKPKYILKGPRTETVTQLQYSFDKDGMHSEQVTVTDKCWMLYLPHGKKYNSIRIVGEKSLKALNLDGPIPLIDEETGETIGSLAQMASSDYGPMEDLVLSKPTKAKQTEGVE